MSFNDALAIFIDRAKFYATDAFLTATQCICSPSATLTINNRTYRIEKLLGEGGFSFVYLVSEESGRRYAMKKILISSGSSGGENEAVKEAMKEVEAYRRFKHHNIIKLLDCAVVQNQDGNGKIIYL
jgi:serine/threonine kinase 16